MSTAVPGIEHSFPAITPGPTPGDIRIAWMDMRTGDWNVFDRRSTDGGRHFGPEVQVSRSVHGYPYIHPDGFDLPYGDYFQLTVDDTFNTSSPATVSAQSSSTTMPSAAVTTESSPPTRAPSTTTPSTWPANRAGPLRCSPT